MERKYYIQFASIMGTKKEPHTVNDEFLFIPTQSINPRIFEFSVDELDRILDQNVRNRHHHPYGFKTTDHSPVSMMKTIDELKEALDGLMEKTKPTTIFWVYLDINYLCLCPQNTTVEEAQAHADAVKAFKLD